MAKHRLIGFFRIVIQTLVVIAALIAIFLTIQEIWHPFNSIIKELTSVIDRINSTMNQELFQGISWGLLALTALVVLIPLLMANVNRKQYLIATQRGVIASIVFFLSQLLYKWAESFSRFWLVVTILAVIIVVFIMIEFLARLSKQEDEVAFRTDLLASFSAGLGAGIVLQLINSLIA